MAIGLFLKITTYFCKLCLMLGNKISKKHIGDLWKGMFRGM